MDEYGPVLDPGTGNPIMQVPQGFYTALQPQLSSADAKPWAVAAAAIAAGGGRGDGWTRSPTWSQALGPLGRAGWLSFSAGAAAAARAMLAGVRFLLLEGMALRWRRCLKVYCT